MTDSPTEFARTDIAVIGMAGRFPGAANIDEFWRNLRDGVEGVRRLSDEELRAAGVPDEMINHPNYVKANGVLDDIDQFDAEFFGLNPREAEVIDPQHRLFLECAWQALESAGYVDETEGPVGVFAGASMNSYLVSNLLRNPEVLAAVGGYQAMLGNDKDFVPMRVSYKLNLKGPGLAIQTACSTSLVAIQVACQSLLTHQSDIALAGGVSAPAVQTAGYIYQEGMIMSPDGHCRAFDAEAKGTVGGSGVGVVVLKRLADAWRDGDTIHAVVKGSAINNDGSGKIGFTAPSVDGQAEVIAMAQAMADVDPETITYVEAHGTGTQLGDPIEIAALTQVFRHSTQKKQYCGIGSVKSNIGHLDAAAGVAGFIKTVLALKHRTIPASLHYQKPNPQIDFASSPFYVNNETREWKTDGMPLRAGVSSFGIGGTNSHVVLEESPQPLPSRSIRPYQTLLLSAATANSLETATRNLAQHLRDHPEQELADVAYTLQVGRKKLPHRRTVVCQSREEAIERLESRNTSTALQSDQRPVVAFMFSGQGSQYVNMAADLYHHESSFRDDVDACCELFRPYLDADLHATLYAQQSTNGHHADVQERLNQTALTQPTLFTIEYALARLWISWGIRPDVMIGHSIGEYAAACLSGVMSLEDAVKTVAWRGRLMQEMAVGSMLAVPLPETSLRANLNDGVSLAAVNSPSFCTVAGQTDRIEALHARLDSDGIHCHRLLTSHAFHSEMMEPMLERFTQHLQDVTLRPPEIPFVSNVTGRRIRADEATDPDYWARHARSTVRFEQGIKEILSHPECLFLEIGPGRSLGSFVKQIGGRQTKVFASLPSHANATDSSCAFIDKTLGELWQHGVDVQWGSLHKPEQLHRVPLPTYPFERKRLWVEAHPTPMLSAAEETSHRTKEPDLADWFYVPSWTRSVAAPVQPAEAGRWLLLIDEDGIGEAIAARLDADGHEAVRVRAGSEFRRTGNREFILPPDSDSAYDQLLSELADHDQLPQRVVHCWSISCDSNPESCTRESFDRAQQLGFYSLVYLAQGLAKRSAVGRLQIDVVSNDLHDVTGDESLRPEWATLLGISKVTPQEMPLVRCRLIDMDVRQHGDAAGQVGQVYSELLSDIQSTTIAFRGPHRWLPGFEALPLEKTGSSQLRQRGVYVITGGLGRIGLAIAESLARHQQAKIALLSRSELPSRREWDAWLATHSDRDKTSRRIQRIQQLIDHGAEVETYSVDVADSSRLPAVLSEVESRFGDIHGVIHAAGVVAGQTIDLTDRSHADSHFQSKALGLIQLSHALAGRKLDFCFLTSSLSAVLGGLGFASYAAANAFMDLFAQRMSRSGPCRWMAVDWDGWQPEQLDEPAPQSEMMESLMTESEGVDAFERLLAHPVPTNVIVSTGDLRSRYRRWVDAVAAPNEQVESEASRPTLHQRPQLDTSYEAPCNDVQQSLTEIWQELLGIDEIGIHDDFFALGGHSLLGTRVITRIQDVFNISLPLRAVFESPTIAALGERIQTSQWVAESQARSGDDSAGEVEELEF